MLSIYVSGRTRSRSNAVTMKAGFEFLALSAHWNVKVRVKTAISALALMVAFCVTSTVLATEGEKPTEANIALATASLLERFQFSGRPLAGRLSSHVLDCYLEALDGAHLLFFQSDLDEFARYRPYLALLTLEAGDTGPAHVIFARYLERLAQKEDFAENLLHTEKFNFSGHDFWLANRHNAPPPRDLAAAQALWRQEVREDYLREELVGTPSGEIAPKLARNYERRLQTIQRLDSDAVLGIYLDALAHAYDPHSEYFGREEAEDFNIEMTLSLCGIGGTLRAKDGYCVIDALVPGGPAARNGLIKPGDRIVAVAQDGSELVDIMNMTPSQVVGLIRGPKGTPVRLSIIPAGASDATRKTLSMVRDVINLADEHAKAVIIDLPQTAGPALRVGVIDLPAFYGRGGEKADRASADISRLIKKLKREGVLGLILDLRRNGGGLMDEAICLTGLFIPSGPVVQTRDSVDDVQICTSPETSALYDGPLVVLTSRLSASASEIMAGALQDYGRALIVGDSSTFGKGTVQILVPLTQIFHHQGLGAVMVTVGKYYRPSGASTQFKGIVPDIVLPSETDLAEIGEANLPNALPWDILPPTTYTKLDLVRPVLAELREKSRVRVTATPGFSLMREELLMANKGESKPISFNLAERHREKAQSSEIDAEMNNFLLTDSARTLPTYDITLANVDSAGMPPARMPARPAVAADHIIENNPEKDIELSETENILADYIHACLLYTSPSPRDRQKSRMPSSA